jgi:hypothetical protein
MIHAITLPKAFGTASFSGMFYDTFMKDVGQDKYVQVGRAALEIPFVFSIGFRTLDELHFIATEAKDFIEMCEENFQVTPKLTFV